MKQNLPGNKTAGCLSLATCNKYLRSVRHAFAHVFSLHIIIKQETSKNLSDIVSEYIFIEKGIYMDLFCLHRASRASN